MLEHLSTDPEAHSLSYSNMFILQIMKTMQAFLEFLLKYLEIKFHIMFCISPTPLFWLPLWFGKIPDF